MRPSPKDDPAAVRRREQLERRLHAPDGARWDLIEPRGSAAHVKSARSARGVQRTTRSSARVVLSARTPRSARVIPQTAPVIGHRAKLNAYLIEPRRSVQITLQKRCQNNAGGARATLNAHLMWRI